MQSDRNEIKNNKERLIYLDNLRAFAIILVVGIHSFGYSLHIGGGLGPVLQFVFYTIAVPVFFFVDGYLLARAVDRDPYKEYFPFLKASAFRLLLPWVIFSLLYVITRGFLEGLGYVREALVIGKSVSQILLLSYGSVYSSQMYFLVSLFLIRLLFPVMKKLVLKSWPNVLAILAAYIAINFLIFDNIAEALKIKDGQEPITHAIWGLQFYILGILLFQLGKVMDLGKLRFLLTLLLFLSLFFYLSYGHSFFYIAQYMYLLLAFVFFFKSNIQSQFLAICGKNTMGIYLIHMPIIMNLMARIANSYISSPIFCFVAIWLGSLFLSLGIVMLIERLPYGYLLFGSSRAS